MFSFSRYVRVVGNFIGKYSDDSVFNTYTSLHGKANQVMINSQLDTEMRIWFVFKALLHCNALHTSAEKYLPLHLVYVKIH